MCLSGLAILELTLLIASEMSPLVIVRKWVMVVRQGDMSTSLRISLV